MKRFSLKAQPPYPSSRRPYWLGGLTDRVQDIKRRQGWFLENLTLAKSVNLLIAVTQFILQREVLRAWPVIVKIDISPLCNLHCTICVHAYATEDSNAELRAQTFQADQRMSLNNFERIVQEVSGKTTAVSLYYVGDPLMHPDLDEMCRVAWEAGLNSHVSTHFSYKMSDERIGDIVTSGLTHLTVCVDGLSQEKYSRTRVGGRIDLVLDNLERLLSRRAELCRIYPKVEVQYLKYQHNIDELEEARNRFLGIGVDQFTDFWGDLHNYTDISPGSYKVIKPRKRKSLPQCLWPHFSLQIKYNGDVVPCVNYRMGPQFSASGDKRVVGNVFQTSVWAVWNSPEYQALRRFVSNPERVHKEPGLAKTFCDGCPQIFETEIHKNLRRGDQHRWEELYQIGDRKRVVRRTSEPDLTQERSDSLSDKVQRGEGR